MLLFIVLGKLVNPKTR